MKIRNYILAAAIAILPSFVMTGCDDDDKDNRALAVLASASGLTFEGIGADPQTITVYSDAEWTAEVPEWITISPATGSGTTEVTVSVLDNLRDGTLNNPRKATLVFKGATVASRSSVIISQLGDNYRDCQVYTVSEISGLADETYFELQNALVVTPLSGGFMVGEGNNYIYVTSNEGVEAGDKVTVFAQKFTDKQKIDYIAADIVTVDSKGNAVVRDEPKNITEDIDTYKSDKREYVAVTGVLSGKNITVNGAKYSVTIADTNPLVDLSSIDGHSVRACGYFAGVDALHVRIYLESIEDLGEARINYWTEDFEWLEPFALAANAGQTVETDNLDAEAPQISSDKTKVNGVSACEYAESLGYEFHRVTTKTAGECIYLQQNYFKFGKTSYQAGITFPSIDKVPAGTANLFIEFDWCPMRQGSGKIDPVDLVLIITNGETETTFDIPTHGWANDHTLEWIRASVDISSVKIDADTKITLKQTQWPAATANRWFLDNVCIFTKL